MSTNVHRRKRSDDMADIDDEDRQHHYRLYGRPQTRGPPSRRSRYLTWSLIAVIILLSLLLLRPSKREKKVDWSKYAYSLYATDTHSLCHALMVFDSLKQLHSKADRVIMYPLQWDTVVDSALDRNSQLLEELKTKYKVKLLPVELQGTNGPAWPGTLNKEASWDTSITKILNFELTTFERILHLDSDITLRQNLDELFLLPPARVAMPRAYWAQMPPPSSEGAQPWPLTSLLILLQPNMKDFKFIMDTMQYWRSEPDFEKNARYDMDLLNYRFGSSAMVLPQRPYAMLTSEFRRMDHTAYLGEPASIAKWDAEAALREAKVIHFSDFPLPKPWVMWPQEALAELQPLCVGFEECAERRIWKQLYDDFRRRRKDLCKILSIPAPDWQKWKVDHGISSNASVNAR